MSIEKVYVLTTGEYSDLRVEGVFTTLEAAERVRASLYGGSQITAYRLDELAEKEAMGMRFYEIKVPIAADTTMVVSEEYPGDEYMYDAPYGAPKYLYIGTWAKSEEHALKIAMEKRAKYLADRTIKEI